jgi:diguanylate cyclase (GGDEF)-like protein/PAS domain S-box-containing protein
VIVSVDDRDITELGDWPITDERMTRLIRTISSYEPRAIGLDIYRDLPVDPGHAELQAVYESTPNLIIIEKLPDSYSIGVDPPEGMATLEQVGFNNILTDVDGRVRRSLLYWWKEDENGERIFKVSFALKLAQLYLSEEGIEPLSADNGALQLGDTVFELLEPYDGGYVRANTRGYQIMTNFRAPANGFEMVSLTDVLEGKADPEQFSDRIVLIGSVANSLQDFVLTPFSTGTDSSAERMSGVELHANFTSQILSAAINDRVLITGWSEAVEWLWILVWAFVGSAVSWRLRSPTRSFVVILISFGGLGLICYGAFLSGLWLPLVPAGLALAVSAIAITAYLARLEEELHKSKEFLNSIIDSIPDPVFVKDIDHRWIVLNEAYANFVGRPIESLLNKSERDVLADDQANVFWQQDEETIKTRQGTETEGEFTNAHGQTYCIATKRSLHRDSAGNTFLVGVIHDITQRKRMEEELRRTAAELVQSNAELREAGASLRQMAYHDTLTGLPNRKLLEERLKEALEIAQANNRLSAILFLDLDGFKQINDTYGHRIGDLLLKAVANRLKNCLRGSDTVARLGGDEFVVLLPAIPGQSNIQTVADKIINNLSQPFALEGKTISITTSLGISAYPLDSESSDELIIKADAAMYRAKEGGKNGYAFFDETAFANFVPPELADSASPDSAAMTESTKDSSTVYSGADAYPVESGKDT